MKPGHWIALIVLVVIGAILIGPQCIDNGGGDGHRSLATLFEDHGIEPLLQAGVGLTPGTVIEVGSDGALRLVATPEEAFENPSALAPIDPPGRVLETAKCVDSISWDGSVSTRLLKTLGLGSSKERLRSQKVVAMETDIRCLDRLEVTSEQMRRARPRPHILKRLKEQPLLAMVQVVWQAQNVEVAFRTKTGYLAEAQLEDLDVDAKGEYEDVSDQEIRYGRKVLGYTSAVWIGGEGTDLEESTREEIGNELRGAGIEVQDEGDVLLAPVSTERLPLAIGLAKAVVKRVQIEDDLERTRTEFTDLRATKDALAQVMSMKENELSAAQQNLEEVRQAHVVLSQSHTELQRTMDERIQIAVADTRSELASVQQNLETAHAAQAELERSVTDARNELASLSQNLETTQAAREELARSNAELRRTMDQRVQAAVTDTRNELARARRDLETTRVARAELEQSVTDVRSELASLSQNLETTQAAREELARSNAELRRTMDQRVQAAVTDTRNELARARRDLETTRVARAELEQSVTDVRSELASLSQNLETTQAAREELARSNAELRRTMDQRVQAAVTDTRNELARARRDLETTRAARDELARNNAELQRTMDERIRRAVSRAREEQGQEIAALRRKLDTGRGVALQLRSIIDATVNEAHRALNSVWRRTPPLDRFRRTSADVRRQIAGADDARALARCDDLIRALRAQDGIRAIVGALERE